jgi:hypothetical protein
MGNAGVTHGITLLEEEISDVSLATFYLFRREDTGAFGCAARSPLC